MYFLDHSIDAWERWCHLRVPVCKCQPFLWRFQTTMERRLRSRRGRRRFVDKTEAAVCRNPLGRPYRRAQACMARRQSWPSPRNCQKPVKKVHFQRVAQSKFSQKLTYRRHIFGGEFVCCVGYEEAGLSHGSVADDHALDRLHRHWLDDKFEGHKAHWAILSDSRWACSWSCSSLVQTWVSERGPWRPPW